MSDSDESDAEQGRDDPGRASAGDPGSAAVAFAGFILAASVIPVPTAASAGGGSGFPTAVFPAWVELTGPFHLVGYAVLAALVSRSAVRRGRTPARSIGVAVAAATGFGFGIELVQAPIPWRSFAWTDAAVNAAGAAVGAVIAVVGVKGAPAAGGRNPRR